MAIEVMNVGGSANLQSKTVTPSTSQQTVTPDSSYDGLSSVQINAMPSGSLNTPSVNSSGLVTASVGTSGYLATNTSKTTQLATQGGKTITPTTSQQTAVTSERYTTGNVYVAGDANLVSGNIKSGVSIFGVNGEFPRTYKVTVVNNTSYNVLIGITQVSTSGGAQLVGASATLAPNIRTTLNIVIKGQFSIEFADEEVSSSYMPQISLEDDSKLEFEDYKLRYDGVPIYEKINSWVYSNYKAEGETVIITGAHRESW